MFWNNINARMSDKINDMMTAVGDRISDMYDKKCLRAPGLNSLL